MLAGSLFWVHRRCLLRPPTRKAVALRSPRHRGRARGADNLPRCFKPRHVDRVGASAHRHDGSLNAFVRRRPEHVWPYRAHHTLDKPNELSGVLAHKPVTLPMATLSMSQACDAASCLSSSPWCSALPPSGRCRRRGSAILMGGQQIAQLPFPSFRGHPRIRRRPGRRSFISRDQAIGSPAWSPVFKRFRDTQEIPHRFSRRDPFAAIPSGSGDRMSALQSLVRGLAHSDIRTARRSQYAYTC